MEQCFVGAHARKEGSLGKTKGIGLKRGLRCTCLYPWHGKTRLELLASGRRWSGLAGEEEGDGEGLF